MKIEDIKKIDNKMKETASAKSKHNSYKLMEKGQLKSTLAGRKLILELTKMLTPVNNNWLTAVLEERRIVENKKYSRKLFKKNKDGVSIPIIKIEALTLMSVNIILSNLLNNKETTKEHICREIGENFERELLYLHFEEHHPDYINRLKKGILEGEKSSLQFMNRNLENVNKQLTINKFTALEPIEKMKLGLVFYNNFVKETFGLFDENEGLIETINIDKKKKRIFPTKSLIDWFNESIDFIANNEIKYEPITYIPEDYKSYISGGYKTIHNSLCKKETNNYFEEVKKADLSDLLEVVNTIQKTSFAIHKKTYDVINYYYTNELELIAENGANIIPSRIIGNDKIEITDEIKKALDINKEKNDLYKQHKAGSKIIKNFVKKHEKWLDIARDYKTAIKRQIISENTNRGKLTQYAFSVDRSARELLGKEFYLPVQLDARGRQYYVPYLNPQSTDFVKGLFTFSKKEKISTNFKDEDLRQFFIQGANEFGQDKLIDDRKVDFILENIQNIVETANNPFSEDSFWKKADKPVIFLQFCFEFKEYINAVAKDQDYFETSLILFSDGKCNGIQHLSAISRDKTAGKLVALEDEDEILTDIYQTVGKKCEQIIKKCCSKKATKFKKSVKYEGEWIEVDYIMTDDGFCFKKKYIDVLKKWKKFGVKRSIAKQPTMTIPYNSKRSGRTSQIVSALREMEEKGEKIPFSFLEIEKAAEIMADITYEACKIVMPNVIKLMLLLEALAKAFSKVSTNGYILIESLYFNFPFIQKYNKMDQEKVRVQHRCETFVLNYKRETEKLSLNSMANSFPPNIIHLLDAVHMFLVIQEMKKRYTDIQFCCVHDSYGVSPKYSKELNDVIREQFVRLYTENDVFNYIKQSVLNSGVKAWEREMSQLKLELKELTELETKNEKEYIKLLSNKNTEIRKKEDALIEFKDTIEEIHLELGDLNITSVLTSHRFFS